ncbi:MAG: hypothetical protein Q8P57_02880 [Candidatus Pacearchaeota archaeon]|nr:hypothetical protein [Candidatus Pacearchaeota archaeon]
MSVERVRDFLYDSFGYGRVEEFLDMGDNVSVNMRDFLRGTLLGTFRTRSSSIRAVSEDDSGAIIRSKAYISAPHIFHHSELRDQINGANRKSFLGRYGLPEEIRKRKFFLSTLSGFKRHTSRRIIGITREIKEGYFPDAECRSSIDGMFSASMNHPDLYLFVQGRDDDNTPKLLVLSFNLGKEDGRNLNDISASYNGLMRRRRE